MFQTRSAAALAALALFLADGSAFAQTMGAESPVSLRDADAPALTKETFTASANRQFARLDANGDGVVERAEEEAAVEKIISRIRTRMARQFTTLDADGDGKVTKAEAEAAAARRFVRLDANGDGTVSASERQRRSRRASPQAPAEGGAN
jgi:hypothetical protein